MGRQQPRDGEERFSAYLDELASVMGRVSRVGPMRDYCTGLLLPGERKSVEPIAAVTAPARVAAQHQSLLHFVAQGGWSDDAVLGKVREMVLPRSNGTARLKRGSSTTPASPSTVSIRSACRISTAARPASRTTARSRCRCRSPITTRACRWRIGSIFPRAGRRTRSAARRPACPTTLYSRPSPRLRSINSHGRARLAFHVASGRVPGRGVGGRS